MDRRCAHTCLRPGGFARQNDRLELRGVATSARSRCYGARLRNPKPDLDAAAPIIVHVFAFLACVYVPCETCGGMSSTSSLIESLVDRVREELTDTMVNSVV